MFDEDRVEIHWNVSAALLRENRGVELVLSEVEQELRQWLEQHPAEPVKL